MRHDHLDDQVEDVCAILRGEGWVVVDGEQIYVEPGHFIAVTVESVSQVRAGDTDVDFIALCGAPH